ncbi:MAG: TonB-dependent receptor [Saprospiraceae bacterium]|nr:TonB-dependent receptor [Saprospiraceae bacterium]
MKLFLPSIAVWAFSLFVFSAQAQDTRISGTVTDGTSGEPLIGVTISVVGAAKGAVSDYDGKYSVPVSASDRQLRFSYTGYNSQVVDINGRTVIDVVMNEDNDVLKEVVVIGYGTQKKSDLTGAVSSLRGSDLRKIPSHAAEQALQGKVAGVQVTSTSGAPGATPVIRVRGVGTFNNSSPIFVVDGVILDNIAFLNSADIESMEVLKDASATAIYGSRGANGVIIITTKLGRIGDIKPSYSFSAEYGIQHLAKKIDLLNGKEFGAYVNDIITGTYNNLDALPNTDWQDLVFRDAPIGNYQFSVSGASDKQQYYLGLGFFNQQGIIEKSDFNRLTIKLNNTYRLSDKLKIGNNLTLAPFSQSNAPNVTYAAYRAQPVIKPYNADGSYAEVPGVGNPLADIEYTNNNNRGLRSVGNIFGELNLDKNLVFRSSFGIDFNYAESRAFTPVFYVSPQQLNEQNDLSIGNFRNSNWLWENTLNYNFEKGEKHRFAMVAGYTMQQLRSRIFTVAAENVISEQENLWYINSNNINPNSVFHGVDPNQNYALLSYLFRANYTLNNKYLFTATFRRDGSSKFIKENRWGNFPSFAVGWNLAEEAFMDKYKAINTLKLRASWGQIGNEKISYLDQYALIINGANAIFGTGENTIAGSTFGKNGNPDIRWETTTQTDIGLEIGLFESKITAELDFYNRLTDDILVELSTPGYTGNGQGVKVRYNAASVLNQGIEFNLVYNGRAGDLKYRIGALGSTVKNEVKSVGGSSGVDSTLVGGFLGNGQSVTLSKEGLPIGAYYGFETGGVFQNQAQLDATPHQSIAGVGDLIFVDQNGDGKINNADRVYIGSAIPKFIYGFSTELTYRAFDLSIDFQGQVGNKLYNGKEAVRPDLYNFETHTLDRWTGDGTSNKEPRASSGGYNWVTSDRFVQDGSFLRLRSVTLGFTLPEKALNRAKMQNARLYLRGTNVWTLTKFTGFTPEIGSNDVLSAGIDYGVYPITAVYSAGVNITF